MGGGKSQTINNTATRISSMQIQSSAYGRCIPIIYGTNKIAGNIFWYDDFTATPHTTSTSSGGGGKGGGGEVTTKSTTYTYSASLMFGLSEGEIEGVGIVWKDKNKTTLDGLGLTLFTGSNTQNPWGYLTAKHPDKALAYRGTAYVCNGAYDLGDNASMGNHTFEVKGLLIYNQDAIPSQILEDFLTNEQYGLGFPVDKLGDLSLFHSYVMANGIFLSPMYDEQQAGADHIKDLLTTCNASPVWSEGILKIIPYGDSEVTGNGYTYSPDLTPIYDLNDSDFIDQDEPIKITRSSNADAYNNLKIEFLNRDNEYNPEIVEVKDLANIDLYGLRPSDTVTRHAITQIDIAKKVAQLALQRALYIRNTYEFTVTWKYALLEPMDLVTLTDEALGLDKTPVRITTIEENDDRTLKITAEEFPFGVSSATLYPSQRSNGTKIDYAIPAGNTNSPVIFEPPLLLSDAYEIWLGLSGGENWGGADLWVSQDGNTYSYLTNIPQRARTGYVTGVSGNTFSVDLNECVGTLQSSSGALALIGSEIVRFSDVSLTNTYKYDLTIIERGLYGTDEVTHLAGERFLRLDAAIVHEAYTSDMVGKTIYYKALAYNVFGSAKQTLAEVEPFFYKIKGSADMSPLPDVENVVAYFKDNVQMLQWSQVVDKFRSPIDYEVRRGEKWGNAQILGRTSSLNFIADMNGTYLVKAHYTTAKGDNVYSENTAELIIEGATIVKNVVATWDEKATGWNGTFSGGAIIQNNNLVLGSGITLSQVPDVAKLVNFGLLDSVSSYGAYEIPSDHIIELNAVNVCRVSLNYSVTGKNITDLFSKIPKLSTWASVVGNNSDHYAVFPKISISQDGVTWGAWQDFFVGDYVGKAFKCKLDIYSFNTSTQPVVSEFGFTVDVPDRVEKGTGIAVGTSGVTVTYAQPFQVAPNVQITILNASQGDDAILTSETENGFNVIIKNGGVNVARSINWLSQGY